MSKVKVESKLLNQPSEMSDRSTFRSQFLADLDEIRRRRNLLRMAEIAFIPVLLLVFLAAVFIHPLFFLLVMVPIFFLRVAHMRALLVVCPKCGECFFDRAQYALVYHRSECAHCGFAV
jgi:hypothetical protein